MFELHWEKEEEAFFDRGLEVSDGRLVQEGIMRCKNGAMVWAVLVGKVKAMIGPCAACRHRLRLNVTSVIGLCGFLLVEDIFAQDLYLKGVSAG